MKFLLDMGLAQSTAQFLRARGYDAIHTNLITTKDVAQVLGLSERLAGIRLIRNSRTLAPQTLLPVIGNTLAVYRQSTGTKPA